MNPRALLVRLWNSLTWRIIVPVVIGLGLAILMSEGAVLLMDDPTTRPLQVTELVIPPGTADRVANGEAAPSIPEGLRLATGDTLVVRNEDGVSHQLGPMWVPAGATGRLVFPRSTTGKYVCSFTPAGYFGIQVDVRLTALERLVYVLISAVPFAAVLTLASVFLWFAQRAGSASSGSDPP